MKKTYTQTDDDPKVFAHPGLTDSQGRKIEVRYTATAWGGHIITPLFKDGSDTLVFDASAWKSYLAWTVSK